MQPVRWLALAILCATTMACQPPDRDIRVSLRDNGLIIDFPWSLWRAVGRQNRTYCVREVELYDSRAVLWTLKMASDGQCIDIQMPIRIGVARSGFESRGIPRLKPRVRYGIAIRGIGRGRVDFELKPGRQAEVLNETDWDELIEHPEQRAWRKHVEALKKLGLSEEELFNRLEADRALELNEIAAVPPASADNATNR